MNDRTPLTVDRDRVSCLLLINSQILKKAINIYNNVLINSQALSRLQPQERQRVVEQYQGYTRRIHCNLQVLTFIHEKYHLDDPSHQTSRTPFPFIIQAPPDMPELNSLYTKLTELYPEALQFLRLKMQQMKEEQMGKSSTNSSTPNVTNTMPNRMSPNGVNTMASNPMSNVNSPMLNNMMPNHMAQQRHQMVQKPQQPQNQPPIHQYQPQKQFANNGMPMNNMTGNQHQHQQQQHQQQQHQQQQQQLNQAVAPQSLYQQMNDGSPGLSEFFN
ncbi:hypothetical protein CANTEDRAFT_111035 [Yamadazyma tenuis ATCC 10573]|uniref:Uncharacterized protein n=1 Tax=Candida tenuis (strain ATCC 10573 / BCRC 21748 / CBS 615 / JCM 9827 / NBRC 10315 / NRRL Y-1498 / VKM Y-70) TaxID=590646 RepID=G3BE46_CANTC|nr:uncharacterized protein CANTEDRAFT_111035 [Yamadazyma tenuis ATCC 10573]EGV60454.1 hypothetical protein CANTEDRAFT_111035 [Yamadazyma tenuis ATCC 10573]